MSKGTMKKENEPRQSDGEKVPHLTADEKISLGLIVQWRSETDQEPRFSRLSNLIAAALATERQRMLEKFRPVIKIVKDSICMSCDESDHDICLAGHSGEKCNCYESEKVLHEIEKESKS